MVKKFNYEISKREFKNLETEATDRKKSEKTVTHN